MAHDSLHERIASSVAAMERGLVEREGAVRLTLLAALAGEHVLLIGPPGTAKSALARRLQHAFEGARYFERLLTRFSVPEELFGPLSLKALEDDRYERLVEGYLPTAGIAFLDEVFKANSAILNALLTLLNEREFDNGTVRVGVPLVCVVGATNEVPDDEALQAFYDRFLVRVPVTPVSDAGFDALLSLRDDHAHRASNSTSLGRAWSLDEVRRLQDRAVDVTIPLDVQRSLHDLRRSLAEAKTPVSDRRWRQLVALLRVQAASLGREQLDLVDLWLVPAVVSSKPEQTLHWQQWFMHAVVKMPPIDGLTHANTRTTTNTNTQTNVPWPWLERAIQAFERQLDIEQRLPAQDDGTSGKLALAKSMGMTTLDAEEDTTFSTTTSTQTGGMTRMVSARLEEKLRRRFSPVHVRARVGQLDEVMAKPCAALPELRAQAAAWRTRLNGHAWIPPALVATINTRFADAIDRLSQGLDRLHAAREGFANLPIDDAMRGAEDTAPLAPEAVTWAA